MGELHEAVRLVGPPRGIRTVYRDVHLLVEAGLVVRLEDGTLRATHRLVRVR